MMMSQSKINLLMRMSVVSEATFTLPARLCIDSIESLYADLDALPLDSEQITINCELVERVDFCGLQLILAYSNRLALESVQLKWIGESQIFIEAIADTQLNGSLGI